MINRSQRTTNTLIGLNTLLGEYEVNVNTAECLCRSASEDNCTFLCLWKICTKAFTYKYIHFCLSVCLSVFLLACLPVRLSVHLNNLSTCLYTYTDLMYLSILLSINIHTRLISTVYIPTTYNSLIFPITCYGILALNLRTHNIKRTRKKQDSVQELLPSLSVELLAVCSEMRI